MRYEDENIWLTQKMMDTLYDVGLPTMHREGLHLLELSDKVSNKVVAVVCHRLKNDDDAVLIE